MKTVVAQLWKPLGDLFNSKKDNFYAPYETFWKPCMESVKAWAKRSGFDYFLDDGSTHNANRPDYDAALGISVPEFNKVYFDHFVQTFHPLTSQYDRVIGIDSDVYVWGDPPITDHPFAVSTEELTMLTTKWIRPRHGVIYGTNLNHYTSWFINSIFKPETRSEVFEYIRLEHKLVQGVTKYHNETICVPYFIDNDWYEYPHHVVWEQSGIPYENSFVHFSGINKTIKFNKFKVWKAYEHVNSVYNKKYKNLKSKGLI